MEHVGLQNVRVYAASPAPIPPRRQCVWFTSPPGRGEDSLRFRQRVPQTNVSLIRHENEKGDGHRGSHNDKSPRDPRCIVHGQPTRFGDVVNGNRYGYGQDGDERNGQGEPQRLWPPVEAVQVENLCDPY